MAIPISALVKLLPTDQLLAKEVASRPSSYHSPTITPPRITITAWVFLPGWKA